MFVVILILIFRQTQEGEVLRPEALPQFFVRVNPKEGLPASFNFQIGIITRVQAVSFVIEHITLKHGGPPVQDPAFLRAKPVIDSLVDSANINAVDESRDSDKARTYVLICSHVIKMETVAPDL